MVLQRLKILRKTQYFRQEDISKKLKIARSTYARKENGTIPITTEEWLKLADVMDVEVDYFFSIRSKNRKIS
jgi:transcriptional regulator with XRE-family HTH domain